MSTSELRYKDYYKILGVDKKSSLDEIKKAFRNLARKYHPDLTKNDQTYEKKFKDIFESYEVLSDPDRRAKYDDFTENEWNRKRATGKLNENLAKKKETSSFSDFFYSVFGSVKDTTLKNIKKINHLEKEITITLEEAHNGVEKEILLPIEDTCKKCHGSGLIAHQTCVTCKGKGVLSISRSLGVKIPSGVSNNSKLCIAGEGHGSGVLKGDLFLTVKLEKHGLFEIDENNDVISEIPITVTEAILGTDIEVPTLKSSVKMKIPAGTQSGQMFRLKGRGLLNKKDNVYSDQFVKINVLIPKELTTKEKELYKELALLERIFPRDHLYKDLSK